MQSVVLVLTLALCLPAWPTFALELLGYDCTKATSYRKIALTEVAPCPAPSSTPPPASYHGALIQRKDFKTVEIFSCSLRYVQTITRCGMHSHIAAPAQFVATGSHRLSREDCIHVINTGFLTLHGKTISGIKEDVPHPTHIFVKGKSSNTGSCKGDDFEFRGVSYESSTMEREYTIKVGRSSAPCDIASGKVNILNSVACRLTDYSCFDDALGAFYWSPTQKSSCEKDGYSTPYTGPIEVVQRPTSTRDDQRFAVVTGPTHIFAMKLLGNETACGQPMTLTEHPKLSIVFLPASAVSPFPPSGTEIDTMTYVNSKFLYTELRLHDRSVNISAHAMERRCQLQRQQLLQKLQLARDQPELISHIFDQPGIIGRAVGELLYVADCPRTSVTLRRTDRCYDAVPVLNDRNESLFLTPITRIITCTAEPVPCDGPAGPAFNFGDGWVQLTPSPRRLTNPTTLQPDDDRVHFQALDAISTAGLAGRNGGIRPTPHLPRVPRRRLKHYRTSGQRGPSGPPVNGIQHLRRRRGHPTRQVSLPQNVGMGVGRRRGGVGPLRRLRHLQDHRPRPHRHRQRAGAAGRHRVQPVPGSGPLVRRHDVGSSASTPGTPGGGRRGRTAAGLPTIRAAGSGGDVAHIADDFAAPGRHKTQHHPELMPRAINHPRNMSLPTPPPPSTSQPHQNSSNKNKNKKKNSLFRPHITSKFRVNRTHKTTHVCGTSPKLKPC